MKILFIITQGKVGGAQKFVSEQMLMLKEEGVELYLATNSEGWLSTTVGSITEKVLFDERIEKQMSLFYAITLAKFIKTNSIDLVICNSANGGLYGRLAAYAVRKKSIYVSHGWSSIYNGGKFSFLLNKIEYLLSYIGDIVLCISENDFNSAKNIIKIPNNKLILISNNVFPLSRDTVQKKIFDKNSIKILFLGRLASPKRPDLLIDAVKLLPNILVDIVGTGPNYSILRNKIEQESITNVRLVGEITNFSSFRDYNIFSLISESEGLPMSVIEAMSCGMPLVLSNIEGCKPLIKSNGILVDNTKESIKDGIIKCISSMKEYSAQSLELFNLEFNLEKNKQKYLTLYYSVIMGNKS
jgi:glycosyltransferase involved in cell wall biosynthesis